MIFLVITSNIMLLFDLSKELEWKTHFILILSYFSNKNWIVSCCVCMCVYIYMKSFSYLVLFENPSIICFWKANFYLFINNINIFINNITFLKKKSFFLIRFFFFCFPKWLRWKEKKKKKKEKKIDRQKNFMIHEISISHHSS